MFSVTENMRAIVYRSYGEPEVLELADVPRPRPLAHEVLVRVEAAGINPPDWKLRRVPYPPDYTEPPLTPGWDVSGVVEEVGEYVGRFKPGDEVFGMLNFPRYAGAYAEYVVARPRQFALKPAGITHVQAAALPMSALTVWQGFTDIADVSPGQRVLVHAAAGGVGHLAVQLAKLRGAYVIGTARAAKHEFVRGLGADEVIDYTAVDFASAVSEVDVVVDIVGGDYPARSLPLIRPGGAFIAVSGVTPADVEAFTAAGVRHGVFVVEPDHAGLAAVAALAAEGSMNVHVDRVFPLAEAAKAHALIESGDFVGKLVLEI
ncbi:NADP-dependent oxidoreductase [Nonomuraea gerenzanensis]|uniref:Bifunctional protein: zinc-containing alcohol dehydrogenase quinone oxidoreductase ( NADPH:quinone reductase) Similar to arginate lyase n=1 Tax=Nonomuraea gerenzanensis TaxID=93944 RepID=A0A1M4E657_9ACTN|nr:NADP-dependent oxidoreductase [Nonomuraea gerenzanensis]UBU16460.1 NADP-dependent oxidoreductase [Nonomuraea gerenzanensis]SBO94280.1 Bifunctional protein: zinc-containing alcohol dehydrogenase; quinone oxidoreductase (NADPH:quinone reductase); Similar to arginate lyase [Nonomuraea gerenzanensis]